MNQYNSAVALAWRANTDISPCTDLAGVQSYIAKYCAKDETPTVPYADMGKALLPYLSDRDVGICFSM